MNGQSRAVVDQKPRKRPMGPSSLKMPRTMVATLGGAGGRVDENEDEDTVDAFAGE